MFKGRPTTLIPRVTTSRWRPTDGERSHPTPVLLRRLYRRRIGPRDLWTNTSITAPRAAACRIRDARWSAALVGGRLRPVGLAASDDDYRRVLAVAGYLAP
jgi:hypothetical protein